MPTAPERVGSKPTVVSPTSEAADLAAEEAERSDARAGRSASSAIPKLSESTAHYEHAADVPIKPGQTLAFAAERGYYAAGRPNPTKAPTTPTSSTTKITALSTRASTESPLREHVETRDGRTTIRLSHATTPAGDKTSQERQVSAHANERSAKPSKDATHRTGVTTVKASSRVDKQLAKNKDRSHHTKSAIGVNHLDDRHNDAAPASPVLDARAARASPLSFGRLPFGAGLKWEASTPLLVGPGFTAETSFGASVTGLRVVHESDGQVAVTLGNEKLVSLSPGAVGSKALDIGETLYGVASKVKNGETLTRRVAGVTVSFTESLSGISASATFHGVTTKAHLDWLGQLVITTSFDVRPTLVNQPVHMSITTTLTPTPKLRGQPVDIRVTAPVPAPNRKRTTEPWYDAALAWVEHAGANVGHAGANAGKLAVALTVGEAEQAYEIGRHIVQGDERLLHKLLGDIHPPAPGTSPWTPPYPPPEPG
jgi:hypothetical protein